MIKGLLELSSALFISALLLGLSYAVFVRKIWGRRRADGADAENKKNFVAIAVVVLGDVGRSPRMQNHAVAIRRSMSSRESSSCAPSLVGDSLDSVLMRESSSLRNPSIRESNVGGLKRKRLSTDGRSNSSEFLGDGENWRAVLVGFEGARCCNEVENDAQIEIIRMGSPVVDNWR